MRSGTGSRDISRMRPSIRPQGSSPIKAKMWSFDEIRPQLRWAAVGRTLRRWIFMESNHIEKKEESPAHTAMAGLCSTGSRTAVIYAKNVFHCRRLHSQRLQISAPNNRCRFAPFQVVLLSFLHSSLLQFMHFQRQNIFAFLLSDYLTNDKAFVCEEIHFRNVI